MRGAIDRVQRMRMTWVLLGIICSAGPVGGQSEPAGIMDSGVPVLTVTSDPPGAVVRLIGDYEFVGRTPWSLHRGLSGLYRVQALVPGYQIWEGQVLLDPSAPQDLHVRLARKSRVWAAARSAVFPGWGQRYNEAPGRGWFYTVAEVGAVGTAIALWEVYQDRVGNFDEAADRYRNAGDVATLRSARRDVVAASEKADDAYDHYRLAITVAGGIYALAFVDALFGPAPAYQERVGSSADAEPAAVPPTTLGFHANLEQGGAGQLGLRLRW